MTTTTTLRCVNGAVPKALYSVPSKAQFEASSWVAATGPENIAAQLIDDDGFLKPLKGQLILWLWREIASGPRTCVVKRVSEKSLERHLLEESEYGEALFVVWFDAKALREAATTNCQMERLIFRALRLMDLDGDAPKLREYEFAGFADEIERYGPVDAAVEGVIGASRGWLQDALPMATNGQEAA